MLKHYFQYTIIFVIASLQISCQAQKTDAKIHPSTPIIETQEVDNLIFTEVWVWEYLNEWIPKGEPGHQGEMAIYFHPEKNYWLFTSEAYGISGEMTDWVIGQTDGKYISQNTDEFGKKSIHKDSITFHNYENLNEHLIPLGTFTSFGNSDMGFPLIQGEKFNVEYLKTNDIATLYLGEINVDMRPVYHFNQLQTEAKLPVFFMTDLPKNQLILSDSTLSSEKHINLKFKYISPTEYHIEMPE